jgi:hypothetical protein
MKSLPLFRPALLLTIALAFLTSLSAQNSAQPPPHALLRLKSGAKSPDAVPLAAGKFSVDDLSPSGTPGASKSRRNNVDYVALKYGRGWARPICGNTKDVTFVSFQVYASKTTVIDIAGARVDGATIPVNGSLQLMFDDSATGGLPWKPLNYHAATGKYDDRRLRRAADQFSAGSPRREVALRRACLPVCASAINPRSISSLSRTYFSAFTV